jgi:four helix bundle protein
MSNYKNLIVWQKADDLAFQIYKLTDSFPKHEQFGITSQLRRAALSIPTNIVEGYNRKGKKELVRFIEIALGSLAETEYLVEFSKKLGYITADITDTEALITEVGKLLWGFQKSKKD